MMFDLRTMCIPVLVAILLWAGGCVSTASYHTAEPVEEGTSEIGVALEGQTAVGEDSSDAVVVSQPRLNARRGLSDKMDLGLTAGLFGIGADLNYMYLEEEMYAVSIAPYQGMMWYDGFGEDFGDDQGQLVLTTLLGNHVDLILTDQLSVTASFKPGLFYQSSAQAQLGQDGVTTESQTNFLLAGSVGAKVDLEGLFLLPEINFMQIFADEQDQFLPGGAEGDLVVTFGLGVGF